MLPGKWLRANGGAACADYLVADAETAYWLHLAVLGNPRSSERMREIDRYDPRAAVAPWITAEGRPLRDRRFASTSGRGSLSRADRCAVRQRGRDLRGGMLQSRVVISVENVSMRFGSKVLFDEVTTSFLAGRRYGLTGPNGSGKSTFMKLLTGEQPPQKGDRRRVRRSSASSSRTSSPSTSSASSTP